MASQTLKLPAQVGLRGKLCVKRSLKLGYMNHRGLTARYTLLQDITHVTDQFKVVARGTIQCSRSFLQYISVRYFEANA